MPIRSFLLPVAALAALIGVLHLAAIEFSLYWTVPWFDVLLHFLGGLWVAALAFWFLFLYRLVPGIPATSSALLVALLAAVLAVGVAWEIFEYLVGAYFAENYPLDTATDLVMDVIGALAAYYLILRSRYSVVLK